MNLKNDSAVLRPVVCLKYAIPLLFATCLAFPAHATLITFDDLTQPSCPPGPDSDFTFCDPLYVTDQYQHLGVTFQGAALSFTYGGTYDPRVSMPNFISDFYGPGMDIYFSGPLPTTVSMYLTTQLQDQLAINAFAADGSLIASKFTEGVTGYDPDFNYQPRQLITFSGAEIAHLRLDELYQRRGVMALDNLFFTREGAAVSEPGMLMLIIGGLCASLFARHSRQGGSRLV